MVSISPSFSSVCSSGGVKSVATREQIYSDVVLVRLAEDFWPMKRYRLKFGSPSLPANKKHKHMQKIVDGVLGVIVPEDDGEGRWRLEHRAGSRLEHDKEHDVGFGSSGGEEEVAEQKFQDIRDEQKKMFAEIAQGALKSALDECVLDEEQRKKAEEQSKRRRAARRKKKGDPGIISKGVAFMRDASSGDEEDDLDSKPTTTARNRLSHHL